MGFSWGATMIAYISARDNKSPNGVSFKATVSFYGQCSLGAVEEHWASRHRAPRRLVE
jgi:dienelactone hydrolase